MKKIKICLLFGGRSGEHEVSLQSAKSIYEVLDKNKYAIFLVGIDKQGHWLLGNSSNYLLNATNPKLIALNKNNTTEVTAIKKHTSSELISPKSGHPISNIDVFFPVMHGTYGEDGSIQGFLELLDVAYVGAGVLGSALGMDKDVMKRLLNHNGIKTAKFKAIKKSQWGSDTLNDVIKVFGFPMFVKPANLGSSVGINKAKNKSELEKFVKEAFLYDTKILIEQPVKGREVECSVLGNDKPIASLPGEVIPQHEFYSYEAKYVDENGAILKIPASNLAKKTIRKIQETAIKAFKSLECSGMARVDFFLEPNGEVIVNEINTIPGFTKISMYPKLWEASGLPYSKLLDKLIELAMEKKKEKGKLKRSYT